MWNGGERMALTMQVEKRLGDFTLSLVLESGSRRLGILGSSGSGKSMTLKLLAGVQTPDRGVIALDGRPLYDAAARVDLPPRDRRVACLFQNYALFPAMTVAQNIAAGLRGLSRTERAARVAELVERFRLGGLEGRHPGHLSGGQQQRAALARMMAPGPEAILLDEPFSALDGPLREELEGQMQEFLSGFPGMAVMVSHSPEELYHFCDTLAVLDGGRLLACGETERIFRCPERAAVARLTGCRNLLPARPAGARALYLPGWEVTLRTAWPVDGSVTAVGLRAQALRPARAGERENVLTGTPGERIATPLQVRAALRPPAGAGQAVWWEAPPGLVAGSLPSALAIAPEDVLPLRED